MDDKKKYVVAVILFIFLGLMIFTFANQDNDEGNRLDGGNGTEEKDNQNNNNDGNSDDNGDNNTNAGNEDNTDIVNNQQNTNTPAQIADNSYDLALKAVINAEEKIDEESYNNAADLVNKVTNNNQKEDLQERLDEVKNGIDAKALVESLEAQVSGSENKDELDLARDFRDDEEVTEKVNELANEELKEDLLARLATLAIVLDDTTGPVINIKNGEVLSEETEIKVEDEGNEITIITLNKGQDSIEIPNGYQATEGVYTLTAIDSAFNETTVTFTVDLTDPIVNVKSGTHSTEDIQVSITDLTFDYVEIYNQDAKTKVLETDSEFTLTDEATYRLTAYDEAGRTTVVWVAIDKTLPTITGVENNAHYKEDVEVTIEDKFLTKVLVNGVEQDGIVTTGQNNEGKTLVLTFTEEGTYVIEAFDKVGNPVTITFTIDKTKPVLTNVVDGGYYKTVTPGVVEENFKNATLKLNGEHIKSYKVGDTLTKEGTYELVVTDKAMNKSQRITFVVDSTDPNAEISYSTQDPTKNAVVVTLTANEEVEILNAGTWNPASGFNTVFKKSYPANTTQTVTVRDRAGNEITVEVKITNIDKVINKPTITYSTTELTNNAVIVTLTADEEVEILNAGTWNPASGFNTVFKKSYPANTTQTVTVRDRAGNETTVEVIITNIDKVAPVATSFGMESSKGLTIDGVHGWYATNGDKIYVYAHFDEELAVSPKLVINETVEVNFDNGTYQEGSGYIYSAVYTVTENDGLVDGPISVKVSGYADEAGNVGETLTNEDITLPGQDKVTIDKTAPAHTILRMYGGSVSQANGKNEWFAKVGSKLYFYVQFDEKLGTSPKLVINGTKEINFNNGTYREGSGYIYGVVYEVNEEDNLGDGLVQIEVSGYTDVVGNVGAVLTNADLNFNGQDNITIDTVNPELDKVQIFNKAAFDKGFVKNGDTIRVLATFKEELSTLPTLNIAGTSVTFTKISGGNGEVIYSADVEIANNEATLAEGNIAFTITNIKDLAGNPGADVTETSAKSALVYDRTSSTITVKNTSVGNGEIYSRLDLQFYDVNGVASVVINGKELPHKGQYVDINDTHAYTFYTGTHTVVVTDKAGNVTTMTFEVDKEAPVVKVVDPNKYQLEVGTPYVEKGYTATDNIDGDITDKVVITYQFQEFGTGTWPFVDSLDVNKLGTYKVIYTVTDAAGNTSKGTRVVQFVDTIPPVIEAHSLVGKDPYYSQISFKISDSYQIDKFTINGVEYDRTNAKYSDANYQNIKSSLKNGENIMVLYDVAGNTTEYRFTLDLVAPTITIKNDSIGDYENLTFYKVSFKISDNNAIDRFTVNGKEYDRTDAKSSDANYGNIKSALVEGENTIVLYDAAGNSTTMTFTIDTTSYISTIDELEAILLKGGEYKLISDITIDSTEATSLTIPTGVAVKLDLQGHKITNQVVGGAAIINNGSLTITGNGSIINGTSDTAKSHTIVNNGTLIIESGNFGTFASSGAAVVNNGTATINGGTFASRQESNEQFGKGPAAYVFINNAEGTMTINDATVNGPTHGIFAAYAGNLIVNGGNYTLVGNNGMGCYVVYTSASGKVTLKGGTINTNEPRHNRVFFVYDNGNHFDQAAIEKGNIVVNGAAIYLNGVKTNY